MKKLIKIAKRLAIAFFWFNWFLAFTANGFAVFDFCATTRTFFHVDSATFFCNVAFFYATFCCL